MEDCYEPRSRASEPLGKETRKILRRLLGQNDASKRTHVTFWVMLERKRVLKQIKADQTEERPVLIYEHAKTGDVFIVPDVRLRLDEIEHVQNEVSQLLRNAAP